MVNNMNVSGYTGTLPASRERADLKIPGGPIYKAQEVLSILDNKGSSALKAWTQKCIKDLQKYALDTDDAEEFIRIALRNGQFLGSEWCEQKPSGPWAACDAYRVFRREELKAAHKEMDFEYYIKFAIGKTGQLLLLVSCHPSENRW
jgi:hypothetical protein